MNGRSIRACMGRREFIGSLMAGAGVSLCGEDSFSAKEEQKPNIIFILADDLGYGDLGCYGQKRIKTPNIDRLAREGMRFTDHYAGSTVCAPSRCCLMTGLHTGHAYIRGNRQVNRHGQQPIPENTMTVARILQKAGYKTSLIGKWGLGGPDSEGHPNRQGFDKFFGYLCQGHAHNYYPEYVYSNSRRFDLPNRVQEGKNYAGSGVATTKSVYSHDIFAEKALDQIEHDNDNPFFLYLALTIPHANNEAGSDGMEVPSDEPYSDENWPQQQKNHAAMITRMDRDVGRIMDKLKKLGIDRDTLVIFSSDNGPHREGGADPAFFASGGSLKGIKRDLYEGGIRVPLIARWPGHIVPGSETSHASAFWDFLPTAAELAGVNAPDGIDGISFLPTLLGKGDQVEHEHLYWEFHEGTSTAQAVRMGRWKAVRHAPSQSPELYDLTADMGEEHDVSGSHPEIISEMRTIMDSARTESKFWTLKG